MIRANTNRQWHDDVSEHAENFVRAATAYYQRMGVQASRPSDVEALLELYNAYVAGVIEWNDLRNTARDDWLKAEIGQPGLNVQAAVIAHRNALLALGNELRDLLATVQPSGHTVNADGSISVNHFQFTPADMADMRAALLAVGQTMITD